MFKVLISSRVVGDLVVTVIDLFEVDDEIVLEILLKVVVI